MLVIVFWTNIRPIHVNKMNETKVTVAGITPNYNYNTTNKELGDDVYIVWLASINLVLLAVVGI